MPTHTLYLDWTRNSTDRTTIRVEIPDGATQGEIDAIVEKAADVAQPPDSSGEWGLDGHRWAGTPPVPVPPPAEPPDDAWIEVPDFGAWAMAERGKWAGNVLLVRRDGPVRLSPKVGWKTPKDDPPTPSAIAKLLRDLSQPRTPEGRCFLDRAYAPILTVPGTTVRRAGPMDPVAIFEGDRIVAVIAAMRVGAGDEPSDAVVEVAP